MVEPFGRCRRNRLNPDNRASNSALSAHKEPAVGGAGTYRGPVARRRLLS